MNPGNSQKSPRDYKKITREAPRKTKISPKLKRRVNSHDPEIAENKKTKYVFGNIGEVWHRAIHAHTEFLEYVFRF